MWRETKLCVSKEKGRGVDGQWGGRVERRRPPVTHAAGTPRSDPRRNCSSERQVEEEARRDACGRPSAWILTHPFNTAVTQGSTFAIHPFL